MKVEVIRLRDNGDTTIGVFRIDYEVICGCIEDEDRTVKLDGETRIPNGTYKLSLREEGGFHKRYLEKYGQHFHFGMLCIYNKPNWVLENDGKKFQYVLIHTGNTDEHTEGCLLPNFGVDFDSGIGSRSGDAYKKLYPILRDMILASPNHEIEIEIKEL